VPGQRPLWAARSAWSSVSPSSAHPGLGAWGSVCGWGTEVDGSFTRAGKQANEPPVTNPRNAVANESPAVLQSCQRDYPPVDETGPVPFRGLQPAAGSHPSTCLLPCMGCCRPSEAGLGAVIQKPLSVSAYCGLRLTSSPQRRENPLASHPSDVLGWGGSPRAAPMLGAG